MSILIHWKRRPIASYWIAMLALFGVFVSRRSGGGGAMTTAFSIASFTSITRRSTMSVKAIPRTASTCSSFLFGTTGRPFLHQQQQQQQQQSRLAGGTFLSSTSTAAEEDTATEAAQKRAVLEQAMDVSHPAYEVLHKDVIAEYGAYCTLYRHKKSGAELLSVASDDDNKVFGITFRTPPEDGTGIAHILEHSVLCGSRKYITKDPFVHLLKGSLQTFLNAFTYPDRTCYVVASQNQKDFYNLVNVYADAVLHPRAITDPMVLAQEGHHLELENKDEPLVYKGVVYNEMKGVYSSPDSLLMRAAQHSIFPDNIYSQDSGGDPRIIPNLTFEQFRDFHRKYYHPSNSRIYFYGDDDVHVRLQLMDEYLNEFDALPESKKQSQIQWQPKSFAEPKRTIEYYPTGTDQPATHSLMVNWLLNDKPLTSFQELSLGVLDHLLMGTTSSILRKTLSESGLGESVTGGGISDELLQNTFSVGLKGVAPDKVNEVEKLILETLNKVAVDGFTEDDIASSLNTIEFALREFNTGSFPKGLSFMLGSMSKWIYDESPTDALKFEEPLAKLKAAIAESGSELFQQLIRDFFLANTHRTTIELAPSKTMEEEQLEEEQKRLADIKGQLSEEEIEEVIRITATLKELQASEDPPEARATIPTLELSDLKRESTEFPIEVRENENNSGVTVVRHELGSTSGIAYVNFGVDLSSLSVDDLALLPLFTNMMTETGAGEYDSVALSRQIGIHTGGIGVTTLITATHEAGTDESLASSGEYMQTKLIIQGKSTSEKSNELFSLMRLILSEARLDSRSKAIEILKESKSRLESRVRGAGHAIVSTRMQARHRVAAYVEEVTKGISYLDTIKLLLKEAEDNWPSLLARLEKMRGTLLNETYCRNGMVLDLTGDEKVLRTIQPNVEAFLDSLPGLSTGGTLPNFYEQTHPWVPEAKTRMAESTPIVDEGFVVPTQVSYVGKSGLLYDVGERIPGSASVVARFLKTGYLWDSVRVIGGAYGGFCTFSPFSGYFSFLSYRDPNLDKTIDVYNAAPDALMEAADAMEEDPSILATAVIGAIGDMDGAISPDQKGFTQFQRWLINESKEYRQQYRDEVLNTKPADFREFAERLRHMKNTSAAVVSSKTAFEAAAKAGKAMTLREVL